jgi:hypothetical protein
MSVATSRPPASSWRPWPKVNARRTRPGGGRHHPVWKHRLADVRAQHVGMVDVGAARHDRVVKPSTRGVVGTQRCAPRGDRGTRRRFQEPSTRCRGVAPEWRGRGVAWPRRGGGSPRRRAGEERPATSEPIHSAGEPVGALQPLAAPVRALGHARLVDATELRLRTVEAAGSHARGQKRPVVRRSFAPFHHRKAPLSWSIPRDRPGEAADSQGVLWPGGPSRTTPAAGRSGPFRACRTSPSRSTAPASGPGRGSGHLRPCRRRRPPPS